MFKTIRAVLRFEQSYVIRRYAKTGKLRDLITPSSLIALILFVFYLLRVAGLIFYNVAIIFDFLVLATSAVVVFTGNWEYILQAKKGGKINGREEQAGGVEEVRTTPELRLSSDKEICNAENMEEDSMANSNFKPDETLGNNSLSDIISYGDAVRDWEMDFDPDSYADKLFANREANAPDSERNAVREGEDLRRTYRTTSLRKFQPLRRPSGEGDTIGKTERELELERRRASNYD